MTALIDQRILVTAPADAIWGVLADQALLTQWRVDCQSISILTTRQFGVGMRRRCTPPKGKDCIEEITAWYEGLGYEYRLVESRRYKVWIGRIRLQASPEGTIVQWTISYQTSGILSRLRDIFGGKGRIEAEAAASLRQLHRLILSYGYQTDGESPRRQTLKPVQKIVRSSSQQVVISAHDAKADTLPRRPADLDQAIATAEVQAVKSDASTPRSALPVVEVTKLNPDPSLAATTTIEKTRLAAPPAEAGKPETTTRPAKPPELEKLPPGMPESLKATPPKGIPKVDVPRLRYADEIASDRKATQETPVVAMPGTSQLPPPTAADDTGQISIWDAFGVAAPSQVDAQALHEIVKIATGEHQAIRIESLLAETDTRTFSPLYNPSFSKLRVRTTGVDTTGLRFKQARQQAKVRRGK